MKSIHVQSRIKASSLARAHRALSTRGKAPSTISETINACVEVCASLTEQMEEDAAAMYVDSLFRKGVAVEEVQKEVTAENKLSTKLTKAMELFQQQMKEQEQND